MGPMSKPQLTNRAALQAHRDRARVQGHDPFLHLDARDELLERLAEVNRTFTAPAIVTGQPWIWGETVPGARVVPDDPVLDLQPNQHDLVIHAMGLHWAEDPVGQVIQCRRALRPDGLFLAVAFGEETLTELRQALAMAETTLRGGLSPRIAPMASLRDYGALLQRAGLALPVADLSPRRVQYRQLTRLVQDLRAVGEGNALAARDPNPLSRRIWSEAKRLYATHFAGADAPYRASFDLIFLTGWSPSDSQPQPLRPGSANTRLADALGVTEFDPRKKPVNDADPT